AYSGGATGGAARAGVAGRARTKENGTGRRSTAWLLAIRVEALADCNPHDDPGDRKRPVRSNGGDAVRVLAGTHANASAVPRGRLPRTAAAAIVAPLCRPLGGAWRGVAWPCVKRRRSSTPTAFAASSPG